jgi:DNA-binding GntR family transcriptional regulator
MQHTGSLSSIVYQQNIVDNRQSMACDLRMNQRSNMRQGFERLRQRPLVLEVRDELERMILDGEVPAGERLNEYDLAERMGVSRGPVREAARSLEHDGLVMTVSNRGVFVREFSVEDALELFDLRATIAGCVCERASATASEESKVRLRACVEGMSEFVARSDEESFFAANNEFHDMLARASGRGRAASLYVALGKEVRLLRRQFLRGQSQLMESNAEHDRIVSAIERGDCGGARREGTAHHLNAKKRLLEAFPGRETAMDYPAKRAGPNHNSTGPHRLDQLREE